MKIAYIITRMDEFGGPQIHVRDFARRLKALGHTPDVIAGSSGPITDALMRDHISCTIIPDLTRSIGVLREIRAFLRVRARLKEIRPNLVSCHSSKAGVVGRLAAASLGIPVIFTVHGWAFTENVSPRARFFYRAIEKIMGYFSTRIITVSDYDRDLGLEARVAPADRIVTVHNGMLDYPVTRVETQAGPVRLIMVARFAPQKDHATLISALDQIRDLPWTLRLAGNGDSSAIKEQIIQLGFQDKIEILGQRADIGDLLNTSDIFVLTTHWEGFPRSIVEAMRAGLPTVATAVAGVPESVIPNETGLLVPHQDVGAVATALRHLIAHKEQREQMGRHARAHYERAFTFDHMFQATVRVYEQATGQPLLSPVDKTGDDRAAA